MGKLVVNMRLISYLSLALTVILCVACKQQQPLDYVNTFIGTAAAGTEGADDHIEAVNEVFGQTMPAVQLPYAMNSWTPQTRLTEVKCISPYYYSDSVFYGFRSSHWINGGCAQDYGSYTVMATTGLLAPSNKERGVPYNHADEIATPAYYRLALPGQGVINEMTATMRAAIFNFTATRADSLWIIVTPNSDHRDCYVEVDKEHNRIYGYNTVYRIYRETGKRAGTKSYFVVEFDRPVSLYGTYGDSTVMRGNNSSKDMDDMGAYAGFSVASGENVKIRCATSFTSMAEAVLNLAAEIPHWDLEAIRSENENTWNRHLDKIKIDAPDKDLKTQFYSAFYRASLLPRVMSDANGSYPSFAGSGKTEVAEGYLYYDDFCAWDTYRTLMPMLNITSPEKVSDMVTSLTAKYEQGGWLPIFPCWSSYTSAMIGDHTASMICDAYLKGTPVRDIETAYEAMRKNAFCVNEDDSLYRDGRGRRALKSYLEYGYIPLEDPVAEAFHRKEQVSRTLEYAYDDFALAQVAEKLGKSEDAAKLKQRAMNYLNVIDPASGYARGRYADGRFIEEFDPFRNQSYITEGYPAHYTWYVPQDPIGLANAMGGRDKFVSKLDSMFSQKIYWHGNEPSHQIAYLYNWVGEPWKTQREVAAIRLREYGNYPGGLAGNDDAGQMSAWYMLSAIGFYPVCPGTNQYAIGTPLYRKAEIDTGDGCKFIVEAPQVSAANIYIQSATLNGKPLTRTYLEHEEIMKGGKLQLVMGSEPSKWGSGLGDVPFSLTKNLK